MTEAGHLMQRLVSGFYAHSAAILVARNPAANGLFTEVEPGQAVPIGRVARKNGEHAVYHFNHYLNLARTDHKLAEDLENTWAVGAMLTIGDALKKANYFDHAPELELIYHLRNGIAHGNKFNIDLVGLKRLERYPAHARLLFKDDPFEVTSDLDGQNVLPGFMSVGDIIALLTSASVPLINKGAGAEHPYPSYYWLNEQA
jgi:hypothetical protein